MNLKKSSLHPPGPGEKRREEEIETSISKNGAGRGGIVAGSGKIAEDEDPISGCEDKERLCEKGTCCDFPKSIRTGAVLCVIARISCN
jgi:hypothetical protein